MLSLDEINQRLRQLKKQARENGPVNVNHEMKELKELGELLKAELSLSKNKKKSLREFEHLDGFLTSNFEYRTYEYITGFTRGWYKAGGTELFFVQVGYGHVTIEMLYSQDPTQQAKEKYARALVHMVQNA